LNFYHVTYCFNLGCKDGGKGCVGQVVGNVDLSTKYEAGSGSSGATIVQPGAVGTNQGTSKLPNGLISKYFLKVGCRSP